VEKIAFLLTVTIFWAITFEETDHACLDGLMVGLMDYAAHLAFVSLVGTEHVEVFQADDPLEPAPPPRLHVHEMFGTPIRIERPEALQSSEIVVIHASATVPIRRRR